MYIKYDTVGFIGLKTKYVFSKVSFGKVRQPYKQTFSIPAHLTPVSCNSGMSRDHPQLEPLWKQQGPWREASFWELREDVKEKRETSLKQVWFWFWYTFILFTVPTIKCFCWLPLRFILLLWSWCHCLWNIDIGYVTVLLIHFQFYGLNKW